MDESMTPERIDEPHSMIVASREEECFVGTTEDAHEIAAEAPSFRNLPGGLSRRSSPRSASPPGQRQRALDRDDGSAMRRSLRTERRPEGQHVVCGPLATEDEADEALDTIGISIP